MKLRRLCTVAGGLDNQLESIAIITDGQDLKIRVKMAPNVPAYVRQSRITRVEELVKIARHQNVPPPETTYPGTDSTGSLTSISRTPLLPAAVFHNPNRRLLGMDPGQVYQVAAVDAHLPEAHQAGAGTAAHVRLERGRHSLEATATAWSNRNERDARASDAARAVLLNRDSVDTMINHLRGLQIAREGCDIRLVSLIGLSGMMKMLTGFGNARTTERGLHSAESACVRQIASILQTPCQGHATAPNS